VARVTCSGAATLFCANVVVSPVAVFVAVPTTRTTASPFEVDGLQARTPRFGSPSRRWSLVVLRHVEVDALGGHRGRASAGDGAVHSVR
jgi:hypothetical protein